MAAYKINCRGLVQGVGFRYFTKLQADEFNLEGIVKNLSDGSVEIFVNGDDSSVMQFLKWCHKGPKSGHVTELHYEDINASLYKNIFDGTFSILR